MTIQARWQANAEIFRAVYEPEEYAPHLLSFCTHDSQETLWEVRVSEKTNEIPVAKAVLPTLPLAGRVCTADALHTHADFMHLLHEQQADTVLYQPAF